MNANDPNLKVQANVLQSTAYLPYGSVLEANLHATPIKVNQGTAVKFPYSNVLQNLRGESAKPELSIYQCQPTAFKKNGVFSVYHLERHLFSTQVFIPMHKEIEYLVVVALNGTDNLPDLKTLKAYTANGAQGITYCPGVWHHPLIAIDHAAQLMCFVWEDGSSKDCEIESFKQSIEVYF